jgi:DNA-binding response OmpR family regulator
MLGVEAPAGRPGDVRAMRARGNFHGGAYEDYEGVSMARIVIADDDADIRELVVFKLRHAGHEVLPVADGAAAVEACLSNTPDLVILDVMMPGMSGLDAARALRADDTMAGVPIIMLTARAQEPDIEQGFDAGADDYVVKPFSPRELASRVAAVLARSS